MAECDTIDLEKVLSEKFPDRKFPGWVVKALARFLKVDIINELIREGYESIEFCRRALDYLDIDLDIVGLENVPADGTLYTFASNHPLGGIDGVSLISIIGERFGNVSVTVNDFLMSIPALRSLGVPINKVGTQARDLPELIDKSFSSDKQVLIFPSGACSRRIDGVIQDPKWNKTFITKSVQFNRSVVPVHFIGRNSNLFYIVDSVRKKLGIKFNVAMAFLPQEASKSRHKHYKVIFGKPIPSTFFDNSRTGTEWVEYVRSKVYSL